MALYKVRGVFGELHMFHPASHCALPAIMGRIPVDAAAALRGRWRCKERHRHQTTYMACPCVPPSHMQVGDLSAPQLRFKVDVNARENHMSGASLALADTFALVVVEVTQKTLRRWAGNALGMLPLMASMEVEPLRWSWWRALKRPCAGAMSGRLC